MEFLNAQVKYVGDQLRGMSVSQKAAIGLLVVVLLGGMWGMIQWSRQAEWTPLLEQTLTADQIEQIEAQLVAAGVQTKRDGDRLLIRGDQEERRRVHAYLGQNNAMPKDTSMGYSALIKEDNIWESDHVKTWKHNRGLESELSAVLSRFRGIKDAQVLIVVPQQRGVGNTAATASASINVKLGGGETLDKPRILAMANFVAGAVPGLDPRNVTITDGSRSYRVPDESDGVSGNLLELQQAQEEHYRKKIYDHLKHIDGVVVNVRARLRQDDEQVSDVKYGAPTVSKVEEESEETQAAASAAGPGVRPNQGRSTTDSGSGASSIKTKNSEISEGKRDEMKKAVVKKAGAVERVTASVSVPSSYLLKILKAQQANATDTSLGAMQKVADVELPRIQHQIEPLIAEAAEKTDKGEKLVVVDWFYALEESTGGTTQKASIDVLQMAKGYGPHVGLGLLAVASVLAVLRIARKAQAAVGKVGLAPAGAPSAAGPGAIPLQTLGGGPEPVGEAQELEGVLMGHEVDESMVRTHQLVKQIGQAVREDPAAVTNLVEYWMKDQK